MKKELDNKLCKDFPVIFQERNKSMQETCMCWGFECGDGWYKIIEDLCIRLNKIEELTGIQPIAVQVKEKFGTLRFYVRYDQNNLKINEDDFKIWDSIIDATIWFAENQSGQICELCGNYGELIQEKGWYTTLCSKCEEKHKEGHKKRLEEYKAKGVIVEENEKSS